MRRLDAVAGRFDAVLCLWQSFGFFDDGTNAAVLAAMARKLRPGGRLVLDVHDRRFFEAHAGTRTLAVEGGHVVERTSLADTRLRVALDYGDGGRDAFEWRLYEPEELVRLAADAGLATLMTCARFDESVSPEGTDPRVQLVFEADRGRQSPDERGGAKRELSSGDHASR